MSNKKGGANKRLKLLKTRARPALNFPELVGIARHSSTPNEAAKKATEELCYELAYLAAGDRVEALKQVKVLQSAVHQLTVIRRDYGRAEFGKFVAANSVSTADSTSPRLLKNVSTDQSKQGEKDMNRKKGTAVKVEKQETNVQPSIPLKHITYNVALNGAHARVRSIQEFTNDADHPVEAIYVFPLPDEASVTACSMKIGRKTIKAELKERELARREYDQAISSGHHGALMEQERPNIFTMNVGGIEPKETIKVEITYVQRIHWQDGGGRFRVPLVVAPRFIPGVPTGKQAGGWAPDTDEVPDASRITPNVAPEGVLYNASINVSFAPGFRCQMTSPSHDMIVKDQTVAKDAKIELKTGDIRTDRDFTLVYKSLSKRPEVAVFQNAGKDESFCLVNILPPGDVATVPSDVVFLLDISGSMDGPKLEGLKVLAKKVLTKIRDQKLGHRVSIIAFESRPHLIVPLSDISDVHLQGIDRLSDTGGTELGPALTAAHQQLGDSGRPRIIFLISDGQTESLNYQGHGVRIIAAGIDSAVNDSTLKQLAQKTNGTYVNYFPGEDFDRAANSLIGMLSGPVLREVKVDSQAEVAGLTDVFTGRPASIALRFDQGLPAEIKISGQDPSGQEQTWNFKPASGKDCDFAAQIWAREAIRETPDKTKQVQISLKHGVICSGTSFVAISEKEVPGEKPVRVEIPVNLPMGWVYDKIFGGASSHVKGLGLNSSRIGAPMALHAFAPPSRSSFGLVDDDFGSGHVDSFECCFEDSPVYGDAECIEEVCECCGCEDEDDVSGGGQEILDDFGYERFNLESLDLVDRLIAIMINIQLPGYPSQNAEATFIELERNLTVKEIKSWSDEKRAMALYFVMRLRSCGLKLEDPKVMDALAVPSKNSKEADCWQYLTAKEIGLGTQGVPAVPNSMDGADYIMWKINPINPQPTGDWSLVP